MGLLKLPSLSLTYITLPVLFLASVARANVDSEPITQLPSVSIEISPDIRIKGSGDDYFAKCITQYDGAVIANYASEYYKTLATRAKELGVVIQGLGEAEHDVVIYLTLDANKSRHKIKSRVKVKTMNRDGEILLSTDLKGSQIVFDEQSPTLEHTCQLLSGEVASGFDKKVKASAQQLALETISHLNNHTAW